MYQIFLQGRLAQYRKKHQQKLLAALLLICSAVGSSHAATYHIDPTHTNVRFAIDHFKTSTNMGGFYNVTGQLQYDPSARTGDIALVIPINSINTGNKAFDIELAGADFFDAKQFPLAAFESTKWYFSNDVTDPTVTKIDGKLTLRGETHPVTLRATKFNCYFSPIVKKPVCGGDFTGVIDRTKWNINKYVLFGISKNLTLNIQIEAIKQ